MLKWTAQDLFNSIDLIWKRGQKNQEDSSIEAQLQLHKPDITFALAEDNVNAWMTHVDSAIKDEMNRLGGPIPADRHPQLILQLMGHLQQENSPYSYIRHVIDKGGRPMLLQDFKAKALLGADELQTA